MYSTLDEFNRDINKINDLIELSENLKEFTSTEVPVDNEYNSSIFIEKSTQIQSLAKKNHPNLPLLNGTLLLFIAGRFEMFIRSSFEELCQNTVDLTDKFQHLPKDMRDNLIKFTAEVISNPRKYGHADLGVKNFVKVLYQNLDDSSPLNEINHTCLSITTENMRPTVIDDLFKRVGIKNIWDRISKQSKILVFFETHDEAKAKTDIQKFLNEIMDKRNSIAHPSASVTWPDTIYIKNVIEFCNVFSGVFIDILETLEIEIQSKISQHQR